LTELYLYCSDRKELPQPRLKLASAGSWVYVTLPSLERGWEDGRKNFLRLVKGEKCNGFVVTEWCKLGRTQKLCVKLQQEP